TTTSPASTRVKRAPSSPPSAKLAAKASFTAAKRGGARAAISTILQRRPLLEVHAAVVLGVGTHHRGHPCGARPHGAGQRQVIDRLRLADRQDLHRPVAAVAPPAGA